MNQRKEKRKHVARPGIEPRTSDLRVRCPTDCATRPSQGSGREIMKGFEQWNPIYHWKEFQLLLDSYPGPVDQQASQPTQLPELLHLPRLDIASTTGYKRVRLFSLPAETVRHIWLLPSLSMISCFLRRLPSTKNGFLLRLSV